VVAAIILDGRRDRAWARSARCGRADGWTAGDGGGHTGVSIPCPDGRGAAYFRVPAALVPNTGYVQFGTNRAHGVPLIRPGSRSRSVTLLLRVAFQTALADQTGLRAHGRRRACRTAGFTAIAAQRAEPTSPACSGWTSPPASRRALVTDRVTLPDRQLRGYLATTARRAPIWWARMFTPSSSCCSAGLSDVV